MAGRVLVYTHESLSYGNPKGVKLKIITKKISLPPLKLVYGDLVFSNVAKNCATFRMS